MPKTADGYKKTTRIVHGAARTGRWDYSHHVVPPLTASTTFRLESVKRGARGFTEFGAYAAEGSEAPVYIYDRLDEPTRGLLESQLASMEGADFCLTFASGMAAISAAMGALLEAGDEVIAHTLLYGCTHSLLTNWYPKQGIKVKRVDFTDAKAVARAITKKTRILYFESPVNPTLDLVDLRSIAELAGKASKGRKRAVRTVIDNTFATPFGQRPMEHGIDVAVHSLTKNIGGFGTEIGGAVCGVKEDFPAVMGYRKDFGGILSPKAAWNILVYGVPTIPLRIKRQQYSALQVAQFLAQHPLVAECRYPGLDSFPQRALALKQMRDFDGGFAPGNMIFFRLHEKKASGIQFIDHLAKHAYCVTLAVSLGHTKTLIEMPSAMTHSAYAGVGPMREHGGIRLSIGLESPVDIVKDLDASLKAVAKRGAR
ncbi:MAG: aminotransferase class I/II-fold pyridoxal phosphate-dependent enzyme [Elusimicrobia bacterium]|nr:aminotransferase class I/II-fold pyridoxal phosphate-dependent enzyme [Elusimicrobiota bacterium]MDE2510454.1 aminotransferase class I/II-fold pyridoxal phosphate-dependent enzyme [Elusimicrobiota bacterium]